MAREEHHAGEQHCRCGSGGGSAPPCRGEGIAGETVAPGRDGLRGDARGDAGLHALGGRGGVEGGEGFVDRAVGLVGLVFHNVS